MSRAKPEINTSPLAGRFRVGKEPDEPTEAQADVAPPPPVEAPTEQPPAQPAPAPPRRQTSRRKQEGADASTEASKDAPVHPATQAPTQAPTQAQTGGGTWTTADLLTGWENPYTVVGQSGVRVSVFLQDAVGVAVKLSRGQTNKQRFFTEAIEHYLIHLGLEHVVEESWQARGGPPGRRDEFRPR